MRLMQRGVEQVAISLSHEPDATKGHAERQRHDRHRDHPPPRRHPGQPHG
jgi:hypothetical protein